MNLLQCQTQSCPQQGNKTHWQTALGSRFNPRLGRERRELGKRGRKRGRKWERKGWDRAGGKIEMSNYQMTAVDSSISMAMLGKFCTGSQTERSCVPFCVPLRLSAQTRAQAKHALSCYREFHCCHRDHAGDNLEHAAASTCLWFVEGEDTALMAVRATQHGLSPAYLATFLIVC